jgi:hypothetical protein
MPRNLLAGIRRHFLLILGVVLCAIPVAWKVPIGPDAYSYRSVAGNDRIVRGTKTNFYLSGGTLYLPVQWTNRSLLVALTHTEEWSEVRLRKLLEANPAIRPLLPDPGAPDGGVEWIHGN